MSYLYGLRIEIIILIGIVFWIMVAHLLCSCTTLSLTEGFEFHTTITPNSGNKTKDIVTSELNANVEDKNIVHDTDFSGAGKQFWFMNPNNWGFGNNEKITDDTKDNVLPEGKSGKTIFKPSCSNTTPDSQYIIVNGQKSVNKEGCGSYPEY